MTWSIGKAPSQAGKVALVTGATGGLGAVVAAELAGLGAQVVLAGRSESNGAKQVESIKSRFPEAKVSFERVDISDLKDVQRFASVVASDYPPLDVLVANAGIMSPGKRALTADGHELTFATNHLGHFALVGRLLPRLQGGRVVLVSSIAARDAKVAWDDLEAERSYSLISVYGQSKLINLLYARELDRRSQRDGWGIRVVASHPGVTRTGFGSNSSWLVRLPLRLLGPIFLQKVEAGALPLIRASTESDLPASTAYFGPEGFHELWRGAGPVPFPPRAEDDADAKKLWDISEELSGVSYQA